MSALRVREWRPLQFGALVGLLTLELPSGLVLHGCSVYNQAGNRWVAPPTRPRVKNGTAVKGVDGKPMLEPAVTFVSTAREEAFSALALAALDAHLDGVACRRAR